MKRFSKPKKVNLFFGIIYSEENIYQKAKKNLLKKLGPIDYQSPVIKFDYTDYYQKEMGKDLKRRFLSFQRLIYPEKIKKVKKIAVSEEKKFSIEGKRKINLDPGYLNTAKLVLSTTKDFSHRIYLGDRVFAEVTLTYSSKDFQDLPWTFPDYKTKEYKKIFLDIRNIYKEKLSKIQKIWDK